MNAFRTIINSKLFNSQRTYNEINKQNRVEAGEFTLTKCIKIWDLQVFSCNLYLSNSLPSPRVPLPCLLSQ